MYVSFICNLFLLILCMWYCSHCNVGISYVAFPLSTLSYPPLLFSPFPRLTGLCLESFCELTARGLGLYLRCSPHLSALNLLLYTFGPRIFYAQHQWTRQGFLLVFILLLYFIILSNACILIFIVIIFTCCFILVHIILRAPLHPSLSQFDSHGPLW
jgi:hypothetical protein